MGHSQRLRLSDVRACFHLLGECRELGIDSGLWLGHMLTGLLRLTGGQVGMGGPTAVRRRRLVPDPAPALDVGWAGQRERTVFLRYLRDQMSLKDPAMRALGPQVARLRSPASALTRSRRQLVDDRTWYRSEAFGEYHLPSGTDDGLMSVAPVPGGGLHGIALFRPPREQPFSARQRRLLDVFHTELATRLPIDLAPPHQNPISTLSPRLRTVLGCLLEGDSEKQVARRLVLTTDTTHQYVKTVYRRMGVSSRAELMARFVRFPAEALLKLGDATDTGVDARGC